MKNKLIYIISSVFFLLTTAIVEAQKGYVVKDQVTYKALPFRLNQVELLESPFKNAMLKDEAWLLDLEPDRLLSRFREYSGLRPKGKIYGGWESRGISGHSLGHYLSAVSMMYAASGDEKFKARADYIVNQLLECQQKKGTGYIGAIPDGDRIFDEVAAGDIHSQGFDLNGGWVPWYTEHKVLAGLIDAYTYTGNQDAKKVAAAFGDWIDTKFKNLSEAQFQKMLDCEHGGMNEALANLYAITGEKKYLALSYRFHHKKVLDPLAAQKDELGGVHANTQIPKVIGSARDYELTGNKEDHVLSKFFWDAVVNHHSYVIGGNSNYEHFSQPDKLSEELSSNTTETCNSYNMLKLTKHLYKLDPSSSYMDYYEKVLYNHILASQNSEDGMVLYYLPLKAGGKKIFGTPEDSFWCCTGTGMENHAKYGEDIYFKDPKGGLYVNLFIPSRLDWAEKGFVIKQESQFPESSKVVFTVEKGNVSTPFHIRVPDWASGASLAVNGKIVDGELRSGTYFTIDRKWKKGDVITYIMPMSLNQQAMPDDKNKVAMLYGPVVLAGKLGPKPIKNRNIPVLVSNDTDARSWIKLTNQKPMTFNTLNTVSTKQETLVPLYKINDERYMVYWDRFSKKGWEKQKAVYELQLKKEEELEARTLDNLRIGEMQPERDHELTGERTFTGDFQERHWRDARDGGYFSFVMDNKGAENAQLICTYYGSDGGNRKFSIQIDGKEIAREKLKAKHPHEMYDEVYEIPSDLIKGKNRITVTFQAAPGNTAGGVFGCRLVKK